MKRRRLGRWMIGVGLVIILASVLWVLEEANGPGTGPKHFAERRSYDIVKKDLHRVFPTAFACGLLGLGLALWGGRIARDTTPET